MSELTIPSFEIHGFRCFEDLRIERFGRVNLIVGKNNVGKTSLLEAIRLYATKGYPEVLWQILDVRDENRHQPQSRFNGGSDAILQSASYLFYGRPDLARQADARVQIGLFGDTASALAIQVESKPARAWAEFVTDKAPLASRPETTWAIGVTWGMVGTWYLELDALTSPRNLRERSGAVPCKFIPACGLENRELTTLWDGIALTNVEGAVLTALRIVAPGVERLTLIADTRQTDRRVPIVTVNGVSEPLFLRSLGDGMQRMLGLALALVNARDGVLLIDEIENGLHYLIQTQMWKLVFETARRLNVQVFATTHSWDCIKAFQQAAEEDTESEGLLIRLGLNESGVSATLFDEDELEIATHEDIEVR